MDDIARLGLEIRSDGVPAATDRLRKFSAQATGTERVAASLMRTLRMLGPLFAGIGSALGISALVRYADAWSDMQSKVGAAVKDMEAAPALMKRMVDLANASYSPLEQTVDIYTRNVGVLRDLGISANEAADFTESLNHMLVITATRGERAASVQNALSKAMAVGKLQADGLETVLTHGGRVAEALAESLGTTVSGLRGMASQGKITGDVIARALLGSLEDVRAEAAEMPATIGDAFVRIQNNLTAFVGILDKTWGISGRVSESMLDMADNILGSVDTIIRLGNIVGAVLGPAFEMLAQGIDAVSAAAPVALAALAGFYAPAVLVGLAALAKAIGVGVVGAIKAVTLAMMANPLGLLIGGLAAAVTAAFMFRDEIKQAIGVDVVGVLVDTGNKTIGLFVGAYEAIRSQWSNLPTFFSAIGKEAWNSFVEAFEGPALTIDTPWGRWESGGFDLTGIKAKLTPAEEAAKGAASAAFVQGFNRNYIEGFTDNLGQMWTNATGAGDAIAALTGELGGGTATSGMSGALSKVDEALKAAHDSAVEFFDTIERGVAGGLSSIIKAAVKGESVIDAMTSAVGRLGDSLIDMAMNQMIQGLFSSLFGGIGGGFSPMLGRGLTGASVFGGTGGFYGIPGYDGGGFTGYGSRTGGIDGRGGFPAILHPNETVVDHTRSANQNQANDNLVIQVNVDARGAQRGTGPEIAEAVRKILPDAIASYNRNPYRR